jgi:transcription initiation factor TFIIB
MEQEQEQPFAIDTKCINEKKSAKTKKNKSQLSQQAKAKIWEILDSEIPQPKPAEHQEVDCLEICLKCASPMMVMEEGFPICTNNSCGALCKDMLDFSPEWRFYGADDKNANDPTRCGNPVNPLLQESSLGCKVLYTNKSSYEMRKIGKWTEWQSVPHREKSLYNEFQYISTMAQNAGIPKIFVDDALSIHKDISEQKMFRGCNRDGIKAASIYISCRLNECTRTPHEIAEIFNLDKASATHGCSLALEILNNVYRNQGQEVAGMTITLPSAFIERYCSKLNINKDFTMLCRFIASKIEKANSIPDNTPHSIAAGIIYFVCQTFLLNPSKSDIATVCKVSEVTISKCAKKLETMKQELVPPSVMQKFCST